MDIFCHSKEIQKIKRIDSVENKLRSYLSFPSSSKNQWHQIKSANEIILEDIEDMEDVEESIIPITFQREVRINREVEVVVMEEAMVTFSLTINE